MLGEVCSSKRDRKQKFQGAVCGHSHGLQFYAGGRRGSNRDPQPQSAKNFVWVSYFFRREVLFCVTVGLDFFGLTL